MAKVLNYSKTKGVHSNAVYIGRSMPDIKGHPLFHNPFKMNGEADRERVVQDFRKHLWGQIKSGAIQLDDLVALDGKDLVCWCAPRSCHGDVLLEAIKWAKCEVEKQNAKFNRMIVEEIRACAP